MRAEAAGDTGPWWQPAILGRGHWDAAGLCDIVCVHALETLAGQIGVFASWPALYSLEERENDICSPAVFW
jgi:hypothetical protein